MQEMANSIEKMLQNTCSDFWHVKVKNDKIICLFMGDFRFSISEEDGDYYVSGKDIPLDILRLVVEFLEIL